MASFRARLAERQRLERENPAEAERQRAQRQAEWEAEQKAQLDAARERVEASIPDRLRLLGVPELAIQTIAKGEDTPALRAARKWHEQKERPFLVLLGGVGTGKTVAAVWAMSRHLAAGRDTPQAGGGKAIPQAVFLRASKFARLSQYDKRDEEWLENELHRSRLLVIDDMGAEFLAAPAMTMLDELLDERYSNARRTILTSNLSGELFRERYGARLWDRFAQVAVVFGAGSQSLRKKPEPKPKAVQS